MTHFDKGTLAAPLERHCDYDMESQRDAGTAVSLNIIVYEDRYDMCVGITNFSAPTNWKLVVRCQL